MFTKAQTIVTHPESYDWTEISTALALLTGRTLDEIHRTVHFETVTEEDWETLTQTGHYDSFRAWKTIPFCRNQCVTLVGSKKDFHHRRVVPVHGDPDAIINAHKLISRVPLYFETSEVYARLKNELDRASERVGCETGYAGLQSLYLHKFIAEFGYEEVTSWEDFLLLVDDEDDLQ